MANKPKGSTASKKTKYAGIHLIAEFWGGRVIESITEIKKILVEATKRSKNTSLGIKIHKFSPQGLTGFILLAESHIAIHTWPELEYVAIDIFSCGSRGKPHLALAYLKKKFRPKKVQVRRIKRG